MSSLVQVLAGFLIVLFGGSYVWLRRTEFVYGPVDDDDRDVPWLDRDGQIRTEDD